ncbi:hypothetical protein Tco_0488438 [Tanacetum coccineum]
MDEEFPATAYPKVQENLKLPTEGDVRLEDLLQASCNLSFSAKPTRKLGFTKSVPLRRSLKEDELKRTLLKRMWGFNLWSRFPYIMTPQYIDKQEIDRSKKIEETVKEAVTASVQYAMRAPLRARFKDLPTSDMKEILLQRMLEENYDKGHEDH